MAFRYTRSGKGLKCIASITGLCQVVSLAHSGVLWVGYKRLMATDGDVQNLVVTASNRKCFGGHKFKI